jgi:hypothetical protein
MSREADDETYLAIDLTGMCRSLGVLPRPGGVFDQDWYHIALLKAGLRAFNLKEEQDSKKS